MKSFLERLGRERLYCDGGTGSLLQAKGLKGGELPEWWNLTHPDVMTDVARSYFEAGSDIVVTNTFGANRLHYPEHLEEIVKEAVAHVREGMRLAGREDGYVALDLGPTGRLMKPMGDLDFEEAVRLFAEVVRYGADAGADLVSIETMGDTLEAKAAVLAVKENSSLPVTVTMVYDSKGRMLTGGTVESVVPMFEGLGVDALGLNCSLGPKQLLPIAEKLVKTASVPVICNPNAGLPRQENGQTVYDLSPEDFAEAMVQIAEAGVHVIGGCCGTTPESIRETVRRTRDLPFQEPVRKYMTAVSSFSRVVEIGRRPVLIGEWINPTGKKRFKQALRENDIDYILEQGIVQEDAGAQILDVNVGLPEIDEPAMLDTVMSRLQSVTALPLEIDTTDPEALSTALRHYNGKALINSVNGKRESMDAVFPAAAKYGGVIVALTLDEDGIPDTAEGRVRIAGRIIREAEAYGIPREDILIDGLAMTISTDSASAQTTLETIRRVREELNVHTILGVSNISFGLPQREIVNSTFFAMALQAGLSCAIMNPLSTAMMAAWRAYIAISGLDPQCREYIEAYADKKEYAFGLSLRGNASNPPLSSPAGTGGVSSEGSASQAESAASATPLMDAVHFGMGERAAAEAVKQIGRGVPPLSIVDGELIPALNLVGKGFESGTLFLPQLLMSAEAARAAFDVIKEAMRGDAQKSKGRVILATVKGDIHDIGKNIVKVLLENYGYEVLDLGKDVPPSKIVSAAVAENISLVGLSALMTTTVGSMEETIRLLRKEKPGTAVVVGGAVMTQEYADSIGADYYAREAIDTVRCADKVCGN